METPADQESALRELPDPELITEWATARKLLALGKGSKTAYEAARAEYDRRIGRSSS